MFVNIGFHITHLLRELFHVNELYIFESAVPGRDTKQ